MTIFRPSSSISARTASIATRRPSPKRRAYRTVLDTVFHALVRWVSPILCFTTEEVWGTRYPGRRLGPPARMARDRRRPGATRRSAAKWDVIRATRERVTEAIEPLRRDKVIGSSLEARIALSRSGTRPHRRDPCRARRNLHRVRSGAGRGRGHRRERGPSYLKCGRCWRHLPEVAEDGGLCARCEEVVNG